MDLSLLFGVLCVVVLTAAWLSDHHILQKLGIVMIIAWSSTNIAVEWLGFVKAPVVIPSLDAVFAITVATIGYMNRSRIALVVFLLYALVGAWHVGAFLLHAQSTYGYYAMLNVLFLAQLLTVGAASGWVALRCRIARGHQRARPDPARG